MILDTEITAPKSQADMYTYIVLSFSGSTAKYVIGLY